MRTDVQKLQFAAARLLRTARLEIRLNLWFPMPWIIGLILALLGYLAVRTAPDASSFPLAWVLSAQIGPLAAVPLLLFLAASVAYRPLRYDTTEIQDSKIVGSEELGLGRWIGMVAAVLVPLMVAYGVTMLGQKIHSRPAIIPAAYALSLARLLPAVLFFSTLSFCLVNLTRVLLLGAGLTVLLWFVLHFGEVFYPTLLRMDLSQNGALYLALTGIVLLVMVLGYGGRRRAKRSRVTYALATGAALLLAATGVHAAWLAAAVPGRASALRTWDRLQDPARGARRPRRRDDPLPNFAWTDTQGRRASLQSMRGKPAMLLFFQPRDGGLLALLQRTAQLQREFPPEKLGVLAVCLSEDLNGAGHAALIARAALPLVTDWGAPSGEEFDRERPASVASWALGVRGTPVALLVDAEGKEVERIQNLSAEGWDDLKRHLRTLIDPEKYPPEPPAPAGPAGPGLAIPGMTP